MSKDVRKEIRRRAQDDLSSRNTFFGIGGEGKFGLPIQVGRLS